MNTSCLISFDHALAAVPYFDLEVYELTSILAPSSDAS